MPMRISTWSSAAWPASELRTFAGRRYNASMRSAIRLAACVAWMLRLSAQSQRPPAEPPPYFDEPSFIAAGVTDTANRGGHGSDPVLRSMEALVKATVSLSSAPPAAASKQSLRDAIARDPRNAALHHSLAELEEKQANFLEALREYQRAAELNPNESHIFDLGAELLAHRAAAQASQVFQRGAKLFPDSARMLLGLAVSAYSQGSYDDARDRFFAAIDRNPNDPEPYLLLGKAQAGAIVQSAGFAERMERFHELHPESACANYYYALSLRRKTNEAERRVTLLENAVRIDPQLAAAWLELGAIHADRNDYAQAIAAWQHAAEAAPRNDEVHYRLAQAYRKTGDTAKAKREIELYEKLSKESADEFERERAGVKQFVFVLPAPAH